MTEPKPRDCYAVATKLPDEFESRIMALADDLNNWRGIAAITLEAVTALGGQHSKMLVYQRVADLCRSKPSAVRAWTRYQREFGDWLDEMPFGVGIEQIRLACREAKQRDVDPLVVLQERANESDNYGGMLCPPRVWAAQLADKGDKVHPVLRALSSAAQNMATAVKHSANGDMRFKALAKEIDTLAMKVDGVLEKAEAIK